MARLASNVRVRWNRALILSVLAQGGWSSPATCEGCGHCRGGRLWAMASMQGAVALSGGVDLGAKLPAAGPHTGRGARTVGLVDDRTAPSRLPLLPHLCKF